MIPAIFLVGFDGGEVVSGFGLEKWKVGFENLGVGLQIWRVCLEKLQVRLQSHKSRLEMDLS